MRRASQVERDGARPARARRRRANGAAARSWCARRWRPWPRTRGPATSESCRMCSPSSPSPDPATVRLDPGALPAAFWTAAPAERQPTLAEAREDLSINGLPSIRLLSSRSASRSSARSPCQPEKPTNFGSATTRAHALGFTKGGTAPLDQDAEVQPGPGRSESARWGAASVDSAPCLLAITAVIASKDHSPGQNGDPILYPLRGILNPAASDATY